MFIYPGLIRMGSKGTSVVTLQQRLKTLGFSPGPIDGIFGKKTKGAVVDYQARNDDTVGRPLSVDGEVGALTWGALFGERSIVKPKPIVVPFNNRVVTEARRWLANKVKEVPNGANWGDGVIEIIKATGGTGPEQWCQRFAWACAWAAAKQCGIADPKKLWRAATPSTCETARWAKTQQWFIAASDVYEKGLVVSPGDFGYIYLDTHLWRGHVGIVESVAGGDVVTIEGNCGNAVARRTHKLKSMAGFVHLKIA